MIYSFSQPVSKASLCHASLWEIICEGTHVRQVTVGSLIFFGPVAQKGKRDSNSSQSVIPTTASMESVVCESVAEHHF